MLAPPRQEPTILSLLFLACIPYEPPFFSDTGSTACASPRTEEIGCVLDGDTFEIGECGGERVRLLGIDSPEVIVESPEDECAEDQYDASTDTCCYGPEASEWLKDLLDDGLSVRLEFDTTCTDTYDRTLAYAWLLPENEGDDTGEEYDEDDEIFINKELLERGFARAYDFDTEIRYYDEFVEIESEARDAGVGLWGACE